MRFFQRAPEAIAHIVMNMRDWDRRELFALRRSDDPADLVSDVLAMPGPFWIAGKDVPIAAFGCMPLWPGVFSMWMFATDDFRQIGLGVTKLVVRSILPTLWSGGAHRLECYSMEGHVDAQRWLEKIGAKREATLRDYGRGLEDYHVYRWSSPCA